MLHGLTMYRNLKINLKKIRILTIENLKNHLISALLNFKYRFLTIYIEPAKERQAGLGIIHPFWEKDGLEGQEDL